MLDPLSPFGHRIVGSPHIIPSFKYRLALYNGFHFFLMVSTIIIVSLQIFAFSIQVLQTKSDPVLFIDTTLWSTSEHWFQLYRYLTYAFVHASTAHLVSNVAMTLILAPTLEAVHGPLTTATTWGVGVILGGILHNLYNQNIAVVGSSAGVFALLAARIYDVFLNLEDMALWQLRLLTLICLGLPTFVDWTSSFHKITSLSHSAHFGGALGGIFISSLPRPVGLTCTSTYNPASPIRKAIGGIGSTTLLLITIPFSLYINT